MSFDERLNQFFANLRTMTLEQKLDIVRKKTNSTLPDYELIDKLAVKDHNMIIMKRQTDYLCEMRDSDGNGSGILVCYNKNLYHGILDIWMLYVLFAGAEYEIR